MTERRTKAVAGGAGPGFLRLAAIVAGLAVLVFAVYASSWHNVMVLDDKTFLDFKRFADFSAFGSYFSKDAWSTWGANSYMYRPLLFASVALDANLFADWFAGYHVINTSLHALVTLLVFAFLSLLLGMDSNARDTRFLVAALAAALYAVHPAHTEVVNSIFNRSSMLAALGTVGGMCWLLKFRVTRPVLAWSGLFLAYCYALYCRETAIILPGLVGILLLAYAEGNWRLRLRAVLPVLVLLPPAFVYLWMRGMALAAPEAQIDSGLMTTLNQLDSSRLANAGVLLDLAGTWMQALYVSVWPIHPKLDYPNASRVLQIAGVFTHLGLIGLGVYMFSRGRKALLTGLLFFYLALLPSSRVVGSEGLPALFERSLYVPLIGLLIVAAAGLSWVARRFDRMLAAAPVILLMFLFVPVTWARNADWSSDLELIEAEYRTGVYTDYTLRLITGVYLTKGDYGRIEQICDANQRQQKWAGDFATHCGIAFSALGRNEDAEHAYLNGTRHAGSRPLAHYNLARLYMSEGRWDETKTQFQEAIETERNPAFKATYTGAMLMYLYPRNMKKREEAVQYFEKALQLEPDLHMAKVWLERIDEASRRKQ